MRFGFRYRSRRQSGGLGDATETETNVVFHVESISTAPRHSERAQMRWNSSDRLRRQSVFFNIKNSRIVILVRMDPLRWIRIKLPVYRAT